MSYISDIRKKVGNDPVFMPLASGIIMENNKILLQKRTDDGTWAFHGGCLELGETFEEALKREIKEELNVLINIGELIDTIEYDYPKFHLSMDCFWCEIINIKELKLNGYLLI